MDIPQDTPAPAGATNKRVASMKSLTFKLFTPLAVVSVGLVSPAVHAQQTFRVYGGLAPTGYTIKFDGNAEPLYANKKAKADYLGGIVGFTWISPERIYADLSLQRSGSATHDLWKDATIGANPVGDQDFSNNSEVLTVGYIHLLSEGATVAGFGGLRHGKTTLNAPSGATAPGGTINWSKDTFDSKGVFVGAAWGRPALGGSISISGALALMGGEWKADTPAGFSADANLTVGFSVSASYTYRITPALGLTGDVRLQTYNYNFTRTTPTGDVDYNVTEGISSIGARLSYQF